MVNSGLGTYIPVVQAGPHYIHTDGAIQNQLSECGL